MGRNARPLSEIQYMSKLTNITELKDCSVDDME